jgi:hypothetical protein
MTQRNNAGREKNGPAARKENGFLIRSHRAILEVFKHAVLRHGKFEHHPAVHR